MSKRTHSLLPLVGLWWAFQLRTPPFSEVSVVRTEPINSLLWYLAESGPTNLSRCNRLENDVNQISGGMCTSSVLIGLCPIVTIWEKPLMIVKKKRHEAMKRILCANPSRKLMSFSERKWLYSHTRKQFSGWSPFSSLPFLILFEKSSEASCVRGTPFLSRINTLHSTCAV